jgi:two-component system, NarL family, response regulator LiaR
MLNVDTKCGLTDREIEILQFLEEGCSNQDIANKVGICVRTVKFHTTNIYAKLGVNSRSKAIAWVWKYGQHQSWPEF